MEVLHLSDLHVTQKGETLDSLWNAAGRSLRGRTFDAVVVSGDLTQAASREEYEDLLSFAQRTLFKLLRRPERRRIILVPGNHDVDWKAADGADHVDLVSGSSDEASRQKLLEEIAEWRKNCEQSPLRVSTSALGHLELYRVRPGSAQYRSRLENCQRFLSRFYGAGRRGPDKRFDLLTAGEDWSVHRFPEDRISFFGFNSCSRNDRFYNGASFDTAAVVAAGQYRERHCGDDLCVAVWHHALTAERGRPDSLSLQDLARLEDAGFVIGLHGHAHESSADRARTLNRMLVLGTGSLGAESKDRGNAVGQRFSVVHLFSSRVRVEVFQRQGQADQYECLHDRPYPLREKPEATAPQVRARVHRRTWHVDPPIPRSGGARAMPPGSGIARVEVELEDVALEAELPLAVLNPPYCAVLFDEANVAGEHHKVREELEPDGRRRYFLKALPDGKPARQVRWGYWVSNAVALNQSELGWLEPREKWFPHLEPGYDIRTHTVRFDCDQLELKVEFDRRSAAFMTDTAVMVERPVDRHGHASWDREVEEEQRCRDLLIDRAGKWAVLRVAAPKRGLRYGIAFRPGLVGPRMPPEAESLAAELLHRCRDERAARTRELLAEAVRQAIAEVLQAKPLAPGQETFLISDGIWTGALWHARSRRLLTAFGEFLPRSWGNRFACGTGVAGHAFRTSGTAAWHGSTGPGSIIYQQEVEPNGPPYAAAMQPSPRGHEWILCCPLFVGPQGPSIGVIGFAGGAARTPVEKRLLDLAENLGSDSKASLRANLETAINIAFWSTLTEPSFGLRDSHRAFARRALAAVKAQRPRP